MEFVEKCREPEVVVCQLEYIKLTNLGVPAVVPPHDNFAYPSKGEKKLILPT